MINKDLNLSLDRNLIKPEQTPGINNKTATLTSLKPGNTTAASSISTPSQASPQSNTRYSRLQPTVIGVVLTNALFLFLAGFWLANYFESASKANLMYTESESQSAATLVKLGNQINTVQKQLTDQSRALQQQLDDFQLVLRVDQQQIVTGYLDMNEKLDSAMNQTQKNTRPAPIHSTSPSAKWYVNLGTFVNERAALGLQQQIIALGYPATINSLTLDGKIAQRVQLPGFADRAAAESVAQKIMKSTQLNGLWAWKGK